MLFGTIWELALPALVALVTAVIWIAVPRLRRNAVLRLALIVSVCLTAI